MNTNASPSGRSALLSTLVGLGASVALAGAGATMLLTQDDTTSLRAPTPAAAIASAATPEPTAAPTAEPTAAPTPAPTAAPTAEPDPTPEPTAVPEPTPEPTGVPESRAVISNGHIVLEGAVPSREVADDIIALAAAILGPDNVVDNYIIDPAADDPNLGNISVEDTILFASGSDEIAPEFVPLLQQALTLMTIRPSVTMSVVGHTDSIGDPLDNLDLSTRRARAVIAWLVDNGIEPERFTGIGRGEAEPIADNATPEGRARNRRIQVYLENLLAD